MDTGGQTSGLIGLISDEDTATGLLLCGIGHQDIKKNTNFLIVTDKPPTSLAEIEEKFKSLTNRDDISVVLITQSIASQIRHLIERHDKPIPAVLEIPSKTSPVRRTLCPPSSVACHPSFSHFMPFIVSSMIRLKTASCRESSCSLAAKVKLQSFGNS